MSPVNAVRSRTVPVHIPVHVPVHVPALLGLLAVVVLGGCADNVYYQTRYVPSEGGAFSGMDGMFRREDPEVYELPANPPALASDDEDRAHRPRVDCRAPGVRFKARRVAGSGEPEAESRSTNEGLVVARLSDDPAAVVSPRPDPRPAIVGIHEEYRYGAPESRGPIPVAGTEDRPVSMRATGIDRRPARPIAAIGDRDDWCPPTTPVEPGLATR